jgi:phage-related protein
MPVFVRPSGGIPGGINPPPIFPPEVPAIGWTDSRGRATTLSDWENGWIVQPGIRGFDLPTYAFYTDESPQIDGNALRGTRATAREIMIPVTFFDTSRESFVERKRSFLRTLNPKLGTGTITAMEPDGSVRTIEAYYVSGAEGDFGSDVSGMRWQTTGFTFSCPSPFWIGDSRSLTFGSGSTGSFFPVLPLVVSSSQVIGAATINNPGDDVAFPIFTIHGPATTAVFTNNTNGKSWSLTASLGATDSLVVDTRERLQTATLNGSTNWWPNLATSSVLWGLEEGDNDISMTLTGTTAATKVQVDFQPRYLTA